MASASTPPRRCWTSSRSWTASATPRGCGSRSSATSPTGARSTRSRSSSRFTGRGGPISTSSRPTALRIPDAIRAFVGERAPDITMSETSDLDDVIGVTDVIYWTRVQEERFVDRAEYDAIADRYVMTPAVLAAREARGDPHAPPAAQGRDGNAGRPRDPRRRPPERLLPPDAERHVRPHGAGRRRPRRERVSDARAVAAPWTCTSTSATSTGRTRRRSARRPRPPWRVATGRSWTCPTPRRRRPPSSGCEPRRHDWPRPPTATTGRGSARPPRARPLRPTKPPKRRAAASG